MVPVAGVEPARYCYQWILSPPRLPIPTHRLLTLKSRRICGGSSGAANQNRTDDLILTKDALYHLSHSSVTALVLYHIPFQNARGF